MQLDQISIQNFRCFEVETINFTPKFNLFIGINGAGKTSLLKAIAAALELLLDRPQDRSKLILFNDSNTRIKAVHTHGKIRYEKSDYIKISAQGEIGGTAKKWWAFPILETYHANIEPSDWPQIKNITAQEGIFNTLPIITYYQTERSWKNATITVESAIRKKESRLDSYDDWADAALDTNSLEAWIIAKSLERLEATAAENMARAVDELDLVNQALQKAIPTIDGLRYDIKYRQMVLDWNHGDSSPFSTLSDGQRGVVALIADIARRIALLNPHLGTEVLQKTPGIVLVDELDIHLHPAWQRRLPEVLKTVFPQVQFIATCHSPQMMGELPAEEIWLMKDGKVMGHPERSLGLSSNQVLEELMGAPSRNEEVTAQLKEINHHLDADEITQAQALVNQLRSRTGDIPEVIEAQASIESLRWLEDDGA